MAANYPRARNRSTGMARDGGQAHASCLSAGCGGTPQGLDAPDGSVPGDGLRGYCSTCRFWLAKAGRPLAGTVIADMDDGSRHRFYFNPAEPVVHTENPSLLLGFGGTPWRVRFFDGRVVETNDLYGEGEIPARFHHMFPPNASLEMLGSYGGRRLDNGGPPLHLASGAIAAADTAPPPRWPSPAAADFPPACPAPIRPVTRQAGRPAGDPYPPNPWQPGQPRARRTRTR